MTVEFIIFKDFDYEFYADLLKINISISKQLTGVIKRVTIILESSI